MADVSFFRRLQGVDRSRSVRNGWRLLRRRGLALLLAGGLAGCALGVEPPRLHTLTAPRAADGASRPAVGWSLQIDPPLAVAGLDTARIALKDAPTSIDYFANVSWTNRTPDMVRDLLLETFEASQRIRAVGRDGAGLRADYLLKLEIRDFQAEYADSRHAAPPTVRIRLSARLLTLPRREIIDATVMEHEVRAASNTFPAILAAWDQANRQALAAVVEWTLTPRPDPEPEKRPRPRLAR